MPQYEINEKLLKVLAEYFPLKADFERAVAELRGGTRVNIERSGLSLSTCIRGLSAMQNRILNNSTREQDVRYVERALATGSTPGSYLIPTIQADRIIDFLSVSGVVRQMRPTIWTMVDREKLTVPISTGFPTVEWLGQSTVQTATDPNLGQLAFNLKTARCLTQVPNELLQTSTPSIDEFLSRAIGVAFGEAEDTAFFATTNTSNGPPSLYAASGLTTVNAAGNSANGGNVTYADLTGLLFQSANAKAKPPLVWAMHPRTFFLRIWSILDLQSRPIIIQDSQAPVAYRLFGYPVFLSPLFPTNQAVGSGTNQSYVVLTNPTYLHLADGPLEVAVSGEFYFSANQTAVRGVKRVDFGFAPAAGICLLKGVN